MQSIILCTTGTERECDYMRELPRGRGSQKNSEQYGLLWISERATKLSAVQHQAFLLNPNAEPKLTINQPQYDNFFINHKFR